LYAEQAKDQDQMEDIRDRAFRIFYKLAYRALLGLWFFTRPTVYGVYIAVWYGEKLLVIENSYKKPFTIPCGRIKRSEESADAAVRELYEEVGIAVDKHGLTYAGEYSVKQNYALDVGKFYEIEFAELPDVRVDNREVVRAHFMSLERVGKLNLSPTVTAWLDNRSK
jgi:8-oxo-dGTP pyrophosphatase MutT (NUDIX family)